MKIKHLLFGLALLFTTNANAATYYFSSSTGSNANQASFSCSQTNPCHDFRGTTLDNLNALSPGDSVLFKRGDTWEGIESDISIRSSGTSGSRIIVGDYGSGNKPSFFSGVVVTGWTLHNGNVWKRSIGTTDTRTVVQGTDTALSWYQVWDSRIPGNNNANDLKEGTFCRSNGGTHCDTWTGGGTTVFVRLWNNENPNTTAVRLPTYVPDSGSGQAGMIRTYQGSNIGNYVTFKNLKSIGSTKIGFSAGATSVYFEDCEAIGAGQDGVLFNSNIGTGEHNCDDCRWYGTVDPTLFGESAGTSYITYSAAGGSGNGQGFTTYAPRSWIYNTVVRNNFMAGVDFLDFSSRTNVTESGVFNCVVHDNARWKDQDLASGTGLPVLGTGISFDPQIYNDGGNKILIANNIVWGAGTQTDANNSKAVISIGSEHPTSKKSENIYVINNLLYKGHWTVLNTNEICYGSTTECPPSGDSTPPLNIKNLYFINNTILAYEAGSFEQLWTLGDLNTTADNIVFRNNVFVSDAYVAGYYGGSALSNHDSDYNLFYRRGFASSTAEIFATNGGSTPRYTLAQWQSITGEDGNSAYGNPLLVLDADNDPNARLQTASPARNAGLEDAYTVPTVWIPDVLETLIFPCGEEVCGTTMTDNSDDDIATNIDIGYHYTTATSGGGGAPGVLTGTNVQPASLSANTVGNVVVSFTTQQAVPSDGKIKITFPTTLGVGFVLNNGGTTGASSVSGFDGTLTVSVVGSTATLTRSAGTSSGAGSKSFTLSFIKNPNISGSTGVYAIETVNASNATIDIDSNVSADTITAGGPTNIEGITISGMSIT